MRKGEGFRVSNSEKIRFGKELKNEEVSEGGAPTVQVSLKWRVKGENFGRDVGSTTEAIEKLSNWMAIPTRAHCHV